MIQKLLKAQKAFKSWTKYCRRILKIKRNRFLYELFKVISVQFSSAIVKISILDDTSILEIFLKFLFSGDPKPEVKLLGNS